MKKEFSCELERLVHEALEKMTEEERQRYISNISYIDDTIRSYLNRHPFLTRF